MINRLIAFIKSLNEKQTVLLLLIITFGLRLYAILMAQGIANDSAAYGFMARDFMKGNFQKALSIAGHPLYPFLISIFSFGPAHVEIVGRLISLFFGTITLLLIYHLVKEEIGHNEALLTCLFYTFHPYLVTYSAMMLTEATYWGLLVLSIYFFWSGLKRESLWRMIPAGIFLGLSYLTRPEGIGYLFVYIIWVIIIAFRKNRLFRGFSQLIILIIFTLIFISPYVLYIRYETGLWLISKKALEIQFQLMYKEIDNKLLQNKSIENPKKDNSPENFKKSDLKKEVLKNEKEKENSKILWVVKNIFNFFPSVLYHYLRAYHFSLWIFLLFGLVRKRSKFNHYELFIASMVLFHIISLSTFTSSTKRFSVPIIPFSLLWINFGVIELKGLLKKVKIFKAERLIHILIILIILIQLPQTLRPERRHRAYQKEVGLWLKQNTSPDAIIMSNTPQEVFYANREFVMFPTDTKIRNPLDSYKEVIKFARNNGVRYILIDKNTHELNPGFIEVINSKESIYFKELRKIYSKPDKKLIVYEVIY